MFCIILYQIEGKIHFGKGGDSRSQPARGGDNRGVRESVIAAIQIISSNSCTAATPAGDFIVYLVGIVMLKEYFSQPRLTTAGYYGNAITGRPE